MKGKIVSICILLVSIFILNSSVVLAKKPPKNRIPSAPTGLTVTSVTDSEVNLNWNSVSKVSGYKIFRASPNDSNYTQIATITSNSYKDTGLTASTKYWYYVQAYNYRGTSPSSNHVNATTKETPVVEVPPVEEPSTSSSKTVLGFATYYYPRDSSSYNSIVNNSTIINEIATATYTTDALGNITGLIPVDQINYANSNKMNTFAMITNNFDGNIAKTLLESPTNRQNLINNILIQLKANSYKGVNVDIEGIFYYDRSYYTAFMKELYNTLNPEGFVVTASVPAKTYDSPMNSWSGAFDYAAIANYVDEIVLMTYDEHYPGGTPGPVASISWVENVVNYAVTVIPKEKILLGTAAYGYDWSSNGTKAYSINQIYNLASTYGAEIQWDSLSKCPYFKYTDENGVQHEVWFENATSLNYKLDLVNNSDIAGIGIWRLGLENTDYWTSIKTKFNK
ncbi:fibronectin type III domain-containing protein [Clostridium botulinum]|nr:fibronectin type III domain-containing protein [Clostridium botulinum]